MAELPNIYGRRPTPRFGGALQSAPLVDTGEAEIGDAIAFAGTQFSKVIRAEEIKRDKAELEARTHRYKERLLELNAEMREKRSAAVAEDPDFYKTYVERHNELRGEILGEIKSPRVGRMMAERINLGELNFKESLINHAHRENAVYRKQSYEGDISVSIDAMKELAYDGEQADQMANDIERLTREYAAEEGIRGNKVEEMVKHNLTAGHYGLIVRFVNDGNYEEAEDYFNRPDVKKTINAKGREQINKLLETAGKTQRAQDLSDEAYGMFKDDSAKGLEYIRNNARAEDRQEALRLLKVRYAEGLQAEKEEAYELSNTAYGYYNAAIESGLQPMEAFRAIPQDVWWELNEKSAKAATALRNMAEKSAQGQTIHTQYEAWNELYSLATGDADMQATFRDPIKTNLNEYADRISTEWLIKFRQMQQSPQELKTVQTNAQIVAKLAEDTGLDKLEASDMLANEEITYQQATGHAPDQATKRDLARGLAADIVFKRSFAPTGPYPQNLLFGRDFTRKAFKANIEGVPNEVVDDIARRIMAKKRAKGLDENVSEAEVIYFYKLINPDAETRALSQDEIDEIRGVRQGATFDTLVPYFRGSEVHPE